ncbi:MAG: UbiD family decarboxylase [Thermodesulfobacteriota bacterium]|nr:UbiD family decarboxylase [Thermodesulfobacteriota bacterium]
MSYPHNDMREFVDDLEQEGELTRIKDEINWDLEAGAISRILSETTLGRSVRNGGQPAVLFENVKGYPEGFRISTMTHGGVKRIAMMLGHKDPDSANYRDLQDLYLEKVSYRTKPNLVSSGPCKENKMVGEEVDLYRFPAPMIHEGDGGRYLCTWTVVVTKDPDSDWVNWGTYRAMINDRRTLTGIITPGQHGLAIYRKYEARNEPMPFAIAINPDPLTLFIGACKVPAGVAEVDVIGGLRGQPLSVVKCETNDLVVPACSEIVLEGIMPPGIRLPEGPFGEYQGYVASPRDDRLVYMVKAITHRNDPIVGLMNPGLPVDECGVCMAVSVAAELKAELKRCGVPVVDVNLMPESGTTLVVVSTKTPAHGLPHIIASVMEASWGMVAFNVLVVNDDVDVFNPAEVIHAWSTRVHPERGIHVRRGRGNPVSTWGSPEEKLNLDLPCILYDATWPVTWPVWDVPRKSSFKTLYPERTQEKIMSNWKEYGFK